MNLTIKSLYLLLASVVILSACSESDEVQGGVNSAGRQIIFHTNLPTVTSRAEIIGTNLPYFHVTAFNPADSRLLSDGVQTPHFSYERIDVESGGSRYISDRCVWPEQGREADQVTFFAFYPELNSGAELVNASSATTIDYKLKGFRVNPDIASQVDFVTADTTGTMLDDVFCGITLPFVHQLSRIEVNAWSANKSCDIEIAGIRFGGVGVEGTFAFSNSDTGNAWYGEPTEKGIVEYIFRPGDFIVSLPNVHSPAAISSSDDAVSIMGTKIRDTDNREHNNCAMLIPSTYTKWDAEADSCNTANNMFISVLLRITDATPTSGINPEDAQRYPYHDLSQGADALDVPVIYFAIDKATGAIVKRLYKNDNAYFTDPDYSDTYFLSADVEIKEFGWAAIPVTVKWEPGKIYTYTLDYTSGIGLHDPELTTTYPSAGDPVISDKVGITYTIKKWNDGGGDEFIVPGS